MSDAKMHALHAAGAARSVEAMLRTLGGEGVRVRVPATGTAAGDGLGIEETLVVEVELSPAVVRAGKEAGEREVLLSAATVQRVCDQQGYAEWRQLFASCAGVVHQQRRWKLEDATAEEFGGAAYLIRLRIAE